QVLERDTVVTNVNFFRARTKQRWGKVPIGPRRKAEEFSLRCARLLIEELQPQAIFAIGLDVFDALGPIHPEVVHERESSSGRKGRVLVKGELARRPVVGALHLSGARMKRADRDKIGDSLQRLLQS